MSFKFVHKKEKIHTIKNVAKPQLCRNIYPYTEVPRIEFDNNFEPYNMPDDIWITDTTFRDGQQAMPPYTVKQITDIFELLHRLSGPDGVIKNSEFFLYSDKDKKAVQKCQEKNYEFPKITGWIRANKRDFQLVKKLGLKETGILTSCSDYHIFLKLRSTRKKILDKYLGIVKEALNNNITPRCHFEDITRADIYGFVIPFTQRLMELAEKNKKEIKIRLCDTMGMGISYPGVTLPRSIPKLANAMIHEGGVPTKWLEWHGHNDFHKVHTNAATAWLYGICGANGTLLGYGERTGNSPIEGLIMEYIGLNGDNNKIDTTVITEIGEYYKELGMKIPHNYPFIGKNFNVTRAGIHADGVLKNPEIYTIFNTNKLLNTSPGIGITDKSGAAGIAFWINSYFDLHPEKQVDKHHPGVLKIANWVSDEYANKQRTTGISDNELESQAKKYIPVLSESEFDSIKQRVTKKITALIEEVADHKYLQSKSEPAIRKHLIKIANENPFIQLIMLTDAVGKRITKNVTQIEEVYKYDSFTPDSLHNREWFINAIKNGKTYVTDFYTSKITTSLCITVSTPVFSKKQEKIIGVIGFDIKFENAAKM